MHPGSKIVFRDRSGKTLANIGVPALKAPTDVLPKTAQVKLIIPATTNLKGASITVEGGGSACGNF
jgi:hypothetical protein